MIGKPKSSAVEILRPMLPGLLSGIGGVVATLVVTAATGWLQFKPTPASVQIRDNSFQVLDTREQRAGVKRPRTLLVVLASVTYEKKGDESAGQCVLRMKFPKSGTLEEIANIFPNALSSEQIGSENSVVQTEIRGGEYQRRLLFEFSSRDRTPPFVELDEIQIELNCLRAVSNIMIVNASTQLCETFRFREGCKLSSAILPSYPEQGG